MRRAWASLDPAMAVRISGALALQAAQIGANWPRAAVEKATAAREAEAEVEGELRRQKSASTIQASYRQKSAERQKQGQAQPAANPLQVALPPSCGEEVNTARQPNHPRHPPRSPTSTKPRTRSASGAKP